jgi:hypothetical protein
MLPQNYIGIFLGLLEIPDLVRCEPVSLAHRLALPLAFFFKDVPGWLFHIDPLC